MAKYTNFNRLLRNNTNIVYSIYEINQDELTFGISFKTLTDYTHEGFFGLCKEDYPNLKTVDDVKEWLNQTVDVPLLDPEPIGKMCMFINGANEEIWGRVKSVNCFFYTIYSHKYDRNFYTDKLDIIDKLPYNTIMSMFKFNGCWSVMYNTSPKSYKLTEEEVDKLFKTRNFEVYQHKVNGKTYDMYYEVV